MIEYLCVFSIALLVRLFPLRSSVIDFDSYGHLGFAQAVKKQGASPWGAIKLQCWESEKYRHPFLWHWFVGRLPLSVLLKHLKWLNGALDAIFATALYAMLATIFLDRESAVLGLLLYLFTPMWFSSVSMGTRVASFTPRIVSEFLANGILAVALLDLNFPLWIQGLIVVTGVSCLILISKFGVQVLFLVFPLTAVITDSALILGGLMLGFIITLVISRGAVLKMLGRQKEHLAEYFKKNKAGKVSVSNRNNFKELLVKKNNGTLDLRGVMWNALARNSYTLTLLQLPLYTFLIGLSGYSLLNSTSTLRMDYLGPVLVATLLYIVLNRPLLLFLGEAERYLNHVSVFIICSAVYLANENQVEWTLWAVVTYGIIFWLLEAFFINKISTQKNRIKADEIIEEFLRKGDRKRMVTSFPYHNFCLYRIMLSTEHEVLYPAHIKNSARLRFVDQFEYRYPYLNIKKLTEISNLTSLDTLIIDRRALEAEGLKDWVAPDAWKKIALQQTVYDVYEKS